MIDFFTMGKISIHLEIDLQKALITVHIILIKNTKQKTNVIGRFSDHMAKRINILKANIFKRYMRLVNR